MIQFDLSMKKALFTIILGLTIMASLKAQTGLHIGLQGQFNSTWIINQNAYYNLSQMDYEYKWGPAGGINVGYNWLDNYGAQIEFNYSFMGQYYKDLIRDFGPYEDPEHPLQQTAVETYRYIDLTYLHIPVLFKYMEGDKKDAIKYHMMGGLQFGILMGAEQTYSADVLDNGEQHQIAVDDPMIIQSVPEFEAAYYASGQKTLAPAEDYFQSFDMGVLVDVGVDIIPNDNIFFTPSVRLYYGFLDLNAPETRELKPRRGENIYKAGHNASIGLNVGINFNIKQSTQKPTEELPQ